MKLVRNVLLLADSLKLFLFLGTPCKKAGNEKHVTNPDPIYVILFVTNNVLLKVTPIHLGTLNVFC